MLSLKLFRFPLKNSTDLSGNILNKIIALIKQIVSKKLEIFYLHIFTEASLPIEKINWILLDDALAQLQFLNTFIEIKVSLIVFDENLEFKYIESKYSEDTVKRWFPQLYNFYKSFLNNGMFK